MMRTLSRTLIRACSALVFLASAGWNSMAVAYEPFLGQIQYFPYSYAPRDWTFCNGQLLQISTYTALFSLFGSSYGGDGRTTFAIPDMRGRAPLHRGTGPGLSAYRIAQRAGAETVTLTINTLPGHGHTLFGTNSPGNQSSPAGAVLARDGRDQTYGNVAPDTQLAAGSIATSGGGGAHDNMPPFLGLNCNVALNGIYPPRN